MKLVLISQRVDEIKDYGELRDSLDEQWHSLFGKMDTVLLPVPNVPENLQYILEKINPDAVILSGGNTPVVYGGTAPQRDKTDEKLIQYAMQENIPLLGVCRGMQSIALYFGSTLKKVEGHVAVRHRIDGNITREVNSYHSYAIDQIGNGLRVLAESMDGVVEAISHVQYSIYGIMWHPERVSGFDIKDIQWIKAKLNL